MKDSKEKQMKREMTLDDDSVEDSLEDGISEVATLTESNSGTSSEDENAPEALVRNENTAVGIVRVVVLLVLVSAATITGILVYRFNSSSEQESFESEFDAVATKIVESMAADAALKFWMARTLANTVTLTMENTGVTALNLTLPPTRWEKITQEVRFNANSNFVAWGPLLSGDEERSTFESYTRTQEFTVGANPVCFVCGSERRGYSNPDDLVELTGFGVFPCSQIENSGRQGIIPKENCEPVSAAVTGTCECIDLPEDAEVLSNLLTIPETMFEVDEAEGVSEEPWGQSWYHPIWQATVLEINDVPTMYNQYSDRPRRDAIQSMKETQMPVISEVILREGKYYEEFGGYIGETTSILYYPVFDPLDVEMVGSITLELRWNTFMTGVFPPSSDLVDVVVENTCGQNYTYHINLEDNSFMLIGEGDHHNSEFEHMHQSSTFEEYEEIVNFAAPVNKNQTGLEYCRYRFMVYPTQEMEDEYISDAPMIYAIVTAGIFVFTSIIFVLYDVIVRRRQSKVMESAKSTMAVVSSLFPQQVRNRILDQAKDYGGDKRSKKGSFLRSTNMKNEIEGFLCDDDNKDSLFGSEPIADLFPHATVMFLDIAGFTAWCSEREPVQVFRLLETIYHAFDEIGRRLQVFKVETIGDSYVSVCGLPHARKNHALIMAQFARHCLVRMSKLTKELERYLGPSTGDLRARVGLHSGPVTAGVLRGEKARFQLFGDTVNTCARMESHGMPHRIHVSKTTADLITASGKGHWLEPRPDKVWIKGKGEVETYWVNPKGRGSVHSGVGSGKESTSERNSEDVGAVKLDQKTKRLVDWNVEVLYTLLEKVAASRARANNTSPSLKKTASRKDLEEIEFASAEKKLLNGTNVIDEMVQILDMPEFDAKQAAKGDTAATLPPEVKSQLQTFVTSIACMYRDVPFHNFEHASHVIMSAYKLMKRIISPDDVDYNQDDAALAKEFHSRTYGIYSDALMQFTALFSCLIHDVDHTGLTNAELIKMESRTATVYRNKSVAEQNSVDLAWDLLMSDNFEAIRAVLYTSEEELTHFRQLLVNAVMATDIADKELKSLRESRWDAAFSDTAATPFSSSNGSKQLKHIHDADNRKATIIYEYIIQASDIAHTMQHWHTYQKFNRRLFEERYVAWINGHTGEKDPSAGWYGGELWFFDNYIIPLAEKLNTCGVFGVSYHEFLTYAVENRKEWVNKGGDCVKDMLAECQAKYGSARKDQQNS